MKIEVGFDDTTHGTLESVDGRIVVTPRTGGRDTLFDTYIETYGQAAAEEQNKAPDLVTADDILTLMADRMRGRTWAIPVLEESK